MKPDVVVVGAGLAGLSAAVRLAEAGASVRVLAKGVGSTYLSAGTIDVLGYDAEGQRVDRPLEALDRLPSGHPYGLVGRAGVSAAVKWFKGRIAQGPRKPYGYTGAAEQNRLLPTAVGALTPSAVVPETMAGGDLRGGGRVCVVGFRALKDFYPALVADNLSRGSDGVEARAVELDLRPEARVDPNALAYARAFDDARFRAEVVAQVVARLAPDERVAFPAVLGLASPHEVWAELEHRFSRPVFEIPTLPPSVPGIRVYQTLGQLLTRAGGRVVLNNVITGAERSGDRLRALKVRVGLREETYEPEWVVLATGGFSAGGLELNSGWVTREVALGLPVVGAPPPGAERFRAAYFGGQPMDRVGVVTDRAQRPLGEDGGRMLENVLVAGATLAGAAPWREKSGDGIALSTGFRAAELIAGTADRRDGGVAAARA
ncbi:MAG: anaerobic glycerol-3-phosphate dehydrogenase subunit GlpB [Solirubrobacterales bacterium]